MIYGDPFKFALQFDVVEAWNEQGSFWKNGLFAIYIGGARLFSLVDAVELRIALGFFKKIPFGKVKFGNADLAAINVFENAHEYFMGDGDELMEGVLCLTCTAMGDEGLNVYLMKSPTGDRLIWSSDGGETVSECLLDKGVVAAVIGGMPPELSLGTD